MDPPIPAPGDPADAATTPHRTLLARYRIERTLGSGGMGEVLLAVDTLLHRRVALKRLRPDPASHADRREAMLKEARRASRISDRRIAAIYDVIDLDDEVVIVMEYVDGVTLRQRMTGPMPLEEFWRLAPQCVEALGAAHAQGVIHRDIKPENLMVTRDGAIKILDFGIAKRSDTAVDEHATTVTETRHAIAGTPSYMAPEAHLGRRVDERADLYSLGVVFYELLTGARPFQGGGHGAALDHILHATPPPVSVANPAAGPALSAVVAKMLAKEPAERFASAADLLRGLDSAQRGETPTPAGVPARGRFVRRAALITAIALAGIAAVALLRNLWQGSMTARLPDDRNLALLTPEASGADSEFASLSLGFGELLGARLQRHVDTKGFQTASFQEGYDEKVRSAAEARQVLGATLALQPTLEQRPDLLRARLDLFDTTHDRLIATRTVDSPLSQPFEFLDRTYRTSAGMLGLVPRGREARLEYGVRGAGTLRFYLQGLGRVRAAKTADDARQAVETLELACRTEPDAAVVRAALATAQLKVYLLGGGANWLTKAADSAREAVALDSMRAEPHGVLATVLGAQKQAAASLPEFARAVELDPTNDEMCLRLARVHNRLGQPEQERDTYLATIEKRPHCWQPYWWLATFYFREGKLDESVRAYEEMIHRSPGLYKGYSSLAAVLILRGEYAQAVDTLRHSIGLRPTKVAFDNLGTAYFNSGRFAEAVDAYNQSFQFGFADYEAWLNLGDAYFWLRNRKDEANDAYTQAVRLGREEMLNRSRLGKSTDVMIPANLATVFPKLGQSDSARAYLHRAVAADSANPMVQYCAALTHWQLGDRTRALTSLQKSVAGGYPTVWLRDSPIFDEWRDVPAFRALVEAAGPKPQPADSVKRGG